MACISAKDAFERRIEESFRVAKRTLASSGKYPIKDSEISCPVYGTETCLLGRSAAFCLYRETPVGSIPCGQLGFLSATANRRRSLQPPSSPGIVYSDPNMCLG